MIKKKNPLNLGLDSNIVSHFQVQHCMQTSVLYLCTRSLYTSNLWLEVLRDKYQLPKIRSLKILFFGLIFANSRKSKLSYLFFLLPWKRLFLVLVNLCSEYPQCYWSWNHETRFFGFQLNE